MGKANNKKRRNHYEIRFYRHWKYGVCYYGRYYKESDHPANDIIGADVMEAGRERVKEQFKIQVTADNHEVINSSDIVILSVKPQFYAEIIAESK